MVLDPSLIFGGAGSGQIDLEVPNLLELVVCQIIMSSLEIHQVEINVEVLHQRAHLLKLEGTGTPENVQFLVERELVLCIMAEAVTQMFQKARCKSFGFSSLGTLQSDAMEAIYERLNSWRLRV